MSPLRPQVLASYKALLRAQKRAFDGDRPTLESARQYTRSKFLEHRGESNSAVITDLVKTAQQAEKIIRQQVVQGVKKKGEENTYVLRIRDETAKGDNLDAKKNKGKVLPRATDCSTC
ncbi:hypothetical protein SeLEV6574_g03709 [Synchytrium endobioticum]|uniref:Mitochondrial zinc maintenance protein 1, mitochondrial n=1 Tax=Synchytrium endobioticum TaxID=286115 RepID=A0A507D300_9FUNG|nr:hypothetical protein SeLEV6574_g03709 [Synchytrium endobioticum]